jgi:phosphoribosyl 1,2-cyclic phosphate phosphodiesterase
VQVNGLNIVIDTGPDFRTQALRAGISRVDAVLYTHHHFDHVVGIDDLRPYFFYNGNPMPCFAPFDTAEALIATFPYIFQDGTYPGVSQLKMQVVEQAFEVSGRYEDNAQQSVKVTPIPMMHGQLQALGYRIGRFAYLTDTNFIPESSYDLLHDLDVVVIDALRHESHHSHFSFSEAIAAAQRINAKQTYFVHMTHYIMHEIEDAKLPPRINLAYDGLEMSVPY